jgi:hypothetical protein
LNERLACPRYDLLSHLICDLGGAFDSTSWAQSQHTVNVGVAVIVEKIGTDVATTCTVRTAELLLVALLPCAVESAAATSALPDEITETAVFAALGEKDARGYNIRRKQQANKEDSNFAH